MMELPPYLRTTLLRQRWLAAAERFELALAAREPDYPAQKKQALEWRLAEREAALHHAYDELHQLNLRFDSQPPPPPPPPRRGAARGP
ncbi:hypothetical protein, partial [Candidatus Raskinella chloraquaticus]|uniref:hypothetical protein n=1 Tax=Candidatus Raskinella chloraquaticus TaxID=1951219 RepID=UPI00366CDC23